MKSVYFPDEIWRHIISYNKVILAKDLNLNTDLHWAAVNNNLEITQKILKLIGKQPFSFWKSLQNIHGHTPEHCAKQYGNSKISDLLLKAEPRLAGIPNYNNEFPIEQLNIHK